MKKIGLVSMFLWVFLTILSGCGGGKSHNPSGGAVYDDFESYTLSDPWSPGNGWSQPGGGLVSWAILSDNGSNVLCHKGDTSNLIHTKFDGLNYTVSTRVKLDPNASMIGIVGRYNSTNHNHYLLTINGLKVIIRKFSGGYGYVVADSDYVHDWTTYQTLTLSMSGSTITGTVSDGTTETTVVYNDNGTTYGDVLGTGYAGIASYKALTDVQNNLFDNFRVTVTSP